MLEKEKEKIKLESKFCKKGEKGSEQLLGGKNRNGWNEACTIGKRESEQRLFKKEKTIVNKESDCKSSKM